MTTIHPSTRRLLAGLLAVIACFAAPFVRAGTHTWTGNAADGYWATPANWQNNYPPALGESSVSLVFPSAPAKRDATNNLNGLVVDTLTLDGASYYLVSSQGRGITLDGGTLFVKSGIHFIREGFPITLNGSCTFSVASGAALFARGTLAGPGGFTKFGDGSIYLDGLAPNTYAGTTLVYDGRLYLGASHPSGGLEVPDLTVPGPLIIGPSTDAANVAPEVRLSFHEQIANHAAVTVNPKGKFLLNGWNERIGALAVNGGQVDSGASPGSLEIGGNVTASAPYAGVTGGSIVGRLNLGNLRRYFNVDSGFTLDVPARIGGGSFGNVYAGIDKTGPGQLNLGGANTFTGLVAVIEGVLSVQHVQALGATNGYTSVGTNATLVLAAGLDSIIARESLSLHGGAKLQAVESLTWSGPVHLSGPAVIDVPNTNHVLTVEGLIDGSGGVRKMGPGELLYAGPGDNTYTGRTIVSAGTLTLNRVFVFGPYIAVPGPLEIGADSAHTPLSYVRLLNDEQIATNAPVTVRASGRLLLQDNTQTLESLTLNSGRMNTGVNGSLKLAGQIASTNGLAGDAWLQGRVDLGGMARVITVEGYPMNLAASISGGIFGKLVKQGTGQLRLTASNPSLGQTFVMAGRLSAEDNDALGSSANYSQTTVSNGALLILTGGLELSENARIDLNDGSTLLTTGNNVINGELWVFDEARIDVGQPGQLTTRKSVNSFGHLTKGGLGTLLLQPGANDIDPSSLYGELTVEAGELHLDWTRNNKPEAAIRGALTIGGPSGSPTATVHVLRNYQITGEDKVRANSSGRVFLAVNTTNHFTGLEGAGLVDISAGSRLSVGGDLGTVSEFSGKIQGGNVTEWNLVKFALGRFILSGINELKGTTHVYGGEFLVNSSQPGTRFRVESGAMLGGNGTVGTIQIYGGKIAPGVTVGALRADTCTAFAAFAANRLAIDLGESMPGSNCDLFAVTTPPNLLLFNLELTVGNGFEPFVGQEFTILRNLGSTQNYGNFVGLPDGTEWRPVPRLRFRINYQGGDGNDVVLTTLEPPAPSEIKAIHYVPGLPAIVSGTGLPGDTYDVEATGDLGSSDSWIKLGTATASAPNGSMYFVDEDAPNHPHRFYRFVLR